MLAGCSLVATLSASRLLNSYQFWFLLCNHLSIQLGHYHGGVLGVLGHLLLVFQFFMLHIFGVKVQGFNLMNIH